MAFLKTSQLFMRPLFKTEVIFNNIMKERIPITKAVDKYIDKIRNETFRLNSRNAIDLLEFPYQTFGKLNQKSLKNIITETYNLLKEKGLSKDPRVIMQLLRCYSDKRVDIDMETILKEIADNEVAFDENICNWMIIRYSNRGEMKAVEILLNEMKSKGIQYYVKQICSIISGYIIAGQPEKAENFIQENKLNIESHDIFYSRCFGYASIVDVAGLKNVLAEMKEKDIKFGAKRYLTLYEQLVYGDVDSSDLNEIIDLTKPSLENCSNKLYSLIGTLNASDHFNHSLIILEKLADLIEMPMGFFELFSTLKCPINTFKQVCVLLVPYCRNFYYKKCIFGDLDFETAIDICHTFPKFGNWKVIYYSILNKAISEKSVPFIEKALHFSTANLQWWDLNILLHQNLLPQMLAEGIVSSYDEILDLFPEFRYMILPVVLMKYLTTGDYGRYNELLTKHKNKKFFLKFNVHYLANEIGYNLVLKDIKKFSDEAGKCFDESLINNILSAIFVKEVTKLSTNDSSNEIGDLIDYAKEWNIEITKLNIDYLIKHCPDVVELIRSSIPIKDDLIVQDKDSSAS